MFKNVTIIGFGLIGSSIAHAIKTYGGAGTVTCADAAADVCARVLELQLAGVATTDLAQAVKGADLIILCVPVGAVEAVIQTIAPHLSQGCIVSDVGSVKGLVEDVFKKHLPDGVHGIPAHPIAGTEHSGPDAGFATLFQNRWLIITPPVGAEPQAVEKLAQLWRGFGSNVEMMDAAHHDRTLAVTSHLPHLIAYTIVDTATQLERDMQSEVIKFSASGFRDFTRIAASNPVMWRDIFLNNREAVLDILQRFTEDLTGLQKAIRQGDGKMLEDTFTRTRAIRRAIIDAKQAG
jgi:cyclohexadieny/prephenate dehydrogenase